VNFKKRKIEMKKVISKIVLAGLVVGTSLVADSSSVFDNGVSLVGIEGGIGTMKTEVNTATSAQKKDYSVPSIGLKVGAEYGNYRVFLSGRYFSQSDFDYITTFGVEGQYLFNFSKAANVFIGANAGIANMKFLADGENSSRSLSDPYLGGDIGVNFHVNENFDLELGARVMNLISENNKNDVTYKFDNIVSGYASLIYRYQMD
jgi:hypothetical protein